MMAAFSSAWLSLPGYQGDFLIEAGMEVEAFHIVGSTSLSSIPIICASAILSARRFGLQCFQFCLFCFTGLSTHHSVMIPHIHIPEIGDQPVEQRFISICQLQFLL